MLVFGLSAEAGDTNNADTVFSPPGGGGGGGGGGGVRMVKSYRCIYTLTHTARDRTV